jgi:hypothetical protein
MRRTGGVGAIVAGAGLAALALGSTPARADWQWTHWGMTPQQVIAASNGQAHAVQGSDTQRVFKMDWRAAGSIEEAGATFELGFYFDPATDGLKVVRYNLNDPSPCPALKEKLVRELGEPRDESRTLQSLSTVTHAFDWDDDRRGDAVTISWLGPVGALRGMCIVTWRPVGMPRG